MWGQLCMPSNLKVVPYDALTKNVAEVRKICNTAESNLKENRIRLYESASNKAFQAVIEH